MPQPQALAFCLDEIKKTQTPEMISPQIRPVLTWGLSNLALSRLKQQLLPKEVAFTLTLMASIPKSLSPHLTGAERTWFLEGGALRPVNTEGTSSVFSIKNSWLP